MCPSTDYLCNDRITCIDRQWLCDGGRDCPAGDDELLIHCQNKTCREDQFQCTDHTCIPGHLMCSGKPECPDGSDELNCSKFFFRNIIFPCATNEFPSLLANKTISNYFFFRINYNDFLVIQPFQLENVTGPLSLIVVAACV